MADTESPTTNVLRDTIHKISDKKAGQICKRFASPEKTKKTFMTVRLTCSSPTHSQSLSRPTRKLGYIRHITSLVANHTAIRHHITSSLANHTAIRRGVIPPPQQPAAAAADARWGQRVTSRRTADRSHSTATSCHIRCPATPRHATSPPGSQEPHHTTYSLNSSTLSSNASTRHAPPV